MSDIELSIIVPHYNDADGINKLLGTIPELNMIEVIIVDDHSDKDEINKINSVIDTRNNVQLFSNPKSENSAGTCRNVGLSNALGKWVIFADSDDYFTDNMFDSVSNYFDSDDDIVFFPPSSIKMNGEYSDRHVYYADIINDYLKENNRTNELKMRILESPCSKMVKRSLIDNNGIEFEETRFSNDVMFSAKVGVMAKKVSACSDIIYMITERDTGLTKTINQDSFMIRKRVLIRRLSYLSKVITRSDIHRLGMRFSGLRYVLSPIKNGYGVNMSIKLLVYSMKEKMPLVY